MSTQEYIRSVTEIVPDDFPTLTPLPEVSASSNSSSFFSNVSWQTWIIIILLLALLGINVFAYLAKGTQESVTIFNKVFAPILSFFGFSALETTKQTVETSATGTKAGVDIVADTTVGAIDVIEETAKQGQTQGQGVPSATTGTSVGVTYPQGQNAASSLPIKQQAKVKQTENELEEWQQGALEKALQDASSKNNGEPVPNESIPTGKAGWCFIGEEAGIRTCSEIGVNDMCMSGDIFPTQAVCMNPNLRA